MIFLRTILEGKTNRLRALPGQKHENGTSVSTTMNIQASRTMRNACPIGTTFACERLEIRTTTQNGKNSEKTFMASIGPLVPLDFQVAGFEPTQQMLDEYKEYCANQKLTQANTVTVASKQSSTSSSKSLLERIRTEKQFARPSIEVDGFSVSQDKWETILTFIHNHDNLLITGPSGTGKTEVVMLACKKMGIPVHKYNMATMEDAQSSMLGVHRMRNGQSVFDEAQFLQDIQKPGVVFLDELNRAPLTALNYLFSCTDGSRNLRNDYVSPAQVVKVHPECTFIATANIGSEFVGTNIIDPALDSRFFRMEMNYPSASDEALVLRSRHGIGGKDALNIAKVAEQIRDLYRKGELEKTVTVRQSLMAAKFVSMGYTAFEAITRVFLPYFEGDDNDGNRSIVKKLICQC